MENIIYILHAFLDVYNGRNNFEISDVCIILYLNKIIKAKS